MTSVKTYECLHRYQPYDGRPAKSEAGTADTEALIPPVGLPAHLFEDLSVIL